jgi:hypothetical protein
MQVESQPITAAPEVQNSNFYHTQFSRYPPPIPATCRQKLTHFPKCQVIFEIPDGWQNPKTK